MRALILVACLACVSDGFRHVHNAESNTIMADGTTRKDNGLDKAKAYDGTTIAPWESKNFARYSDGELNDAELGLANLMDALHDPSTLSQMAQMLSDPESLAEMKKTMANPSFKAQVERALKQSADAAGVAQEVSAKVGVREWELESAASYSAGKSSLAELGATNLLAAMSDPSVMNEAVQMLRNPENAAAVKKMRSDPSFQQEAKRMAVEMAKEQEAKRLETIPELEDAPQSLAQVSGAKAQGGAEVSYNPLVKALGLGLLAANPAAAYAPAGPVTRVPGGVRPITRGAATLMQADKNAGKEPSVPTKNFDVKDLAGVTEPLGFWDPAGFTTDEAEGKIRFYREVELKHGRVAMLAALGFLVAEQFHPLFGGDIDVPAYRAFQQTPLETFWPAVVAAIAIPEIYSVQSFERPQDSGGQQWRIRSDHAPGDFGFDPLGLKPKDPAELKELQSKEINNGRLAMLATAGMVAQELANGQKLFMNDAAAQDWLISGN